MKPIDRSEVLGLADYETVRDRFRARVLAEKKRRRVAVGPKVSVLFENRDTVLLQIQEMLRTERITRPAAVEHEIATYNELVPGDGELSCTVMVEIPERAERDAFLHATKGLERHVWLVAGDHRVAARSIDGAETEPADRTRAVHYLRLSLPPDLADALRAAAAGRPPPSAPELLIDHPAYAARAALSADTVVLLGEDLRE